MIFRFRYSLLLFFVIVVLSLIPIPEMKSLSGVSFIDKWTHVAMYAAFSFAMCIDAQRLQKQQKWVVLVLTIIIPTLIGGVLELVQPLVQRSCELLDFWADGIGAMVGSFIGLAVASWHRG